MLRVNIPARRDAPKIIEYFLFVKLSVLKRKRMLIVTKEQEARPKLKCLEGS